MNVLLLLSAGTSLRRAKPGIADTRAGQAIAPVEKILKEILPISSHLRALDKAAQVEGDRLLLSYKLDKLLFRAYLLVLAIYAVTLASLWVAWSKH